LAAFGRELDVFGGKRRFSAVFGDLMACNLFVFNDAFVIWLLNQFDSMI
jgi:hypothetical protein